MHMCMCMCITLCAWQARPALAAVLEQLQGKALFAVDPSEQLVESP